MVLVFHGVVLDEVQVRPVGKSTYICVPVRPRQIQVGPSLSVVHLGPMAWKARDVVWFNNFLDLVYD